jgi:hypothetical protein
MRHAMRETAKALAARQSKPSCAWAQFSPMSAEGRAAAANRQTCTAVVALTEATQARAMGMLTPFLFLAF